MHDKTRLKVFACWQPWRQQLPESLKLIIFPLCYILGSRHQALGTTLQNCYSVPTAVLALQFSFTKRVCEEETGHFCKDFYYCLSQSWLWIYYMKKRKKRKKHHPSQQLKRKKLQPLHTSSYQASNSFVGFLFQRTFFSNFCMLSYGGRVSGWWQICISSETKYVLKYKSAIEKRTIQNRRNMVRQAAVQNCNLQKSQQQIWLGNNKNKQAYLQLHKSYKGPSINYVVSVGVGGGQKLPIQTTQSGLHDCFL